MTLRRLWHPATAGAAAHAETEEQLVRAQRDADMFRFICPSYTIPGREDWGAL